MNCPRCGMETTKEMGFCPGCGASLLKITLMSRSVSGNCAFSMGGDLDDTPNPGVSIDYSPMKGYPVPEDDPPAYPGTEAFYGTPASNDGTAVPPVADGGCAAPADPPAESFGSVPSVWDQVNGDADSEPTVVSATPKGRTCPKCGAPTAPGTAFCGNCGQALAAAPAAPVAPAPPVGVSASPGYVAPGASGYVPPMAPDHVMHYVPPRPRRARRGSTGKTKILVPVLACVSLLMVAAIVIGILSITGGPLAKISSAMEKTLQAGNLTMDFTIDVDGGGELEGTAWVELDTSHQELTLYIECENGSHFYKYGIYDGYSFYREYYRGELTDEGWADVADELDDFFDSLDEYDGMSLEEILEELDDRSDGEFSEIFDLDELETDIVNFTKTASKTEWLEKNLDYSKSKKDGETLYGFEFKVYRLLLNILPEFKSAFEDKDVYMEARDELKEAISDGYEISIETAIGVKSGYLSSIQFCWEDSWEDVEFSADISDVGKTELDLDELEDMLDDILETVRY